MTVFDRFRLDGRRAMITGGSRGLGRAMALAFAEAGADLLIVGREMESLRTAQSEIAATGRNVEVIQGDVSISTDCERICREALDRFSPISVLVNNVGGRRTGTPMEDLTLAEWQQVMDLNLTSTFLCCKHIGGEMIKRKSGSIVNLSSIAGVIVTRAVQGRAYEASKAGVIALTKALAVDWAPHNVRVNVIAPGGFLTEPNRRWMRERPEWKPTFEGMIPMGRLGEPEEIGPLALYLASDASSYVTGATFMIDGGYTAW